MTPQEWLWILLLGTSCGLLGQSIRVLVGLRKAADAGGIVFDPVRFGLSLLLGASAGALGSLVVLKMGVSTVSTEQVLGLVSAGYSGADFFEGFLGKYLPH